MLLLRALFAAASAVTASAAVAGRAGATAHGAGGAVARGGVSRAEDTASVAISLPGAPALHRFDGIGALSAGASSRLLYDSAEPMRSDILDYLFLPNFAASLHILKVEIGGDSESTDGTELSHSHSRGDLNCARGYETWLVREAKARNPDVFIYGLSWAVPAYIGNGSYYSPENVQYQTQWVECVRNVTGFGVDALGLWNEKQQPVDPSYVLELKAALAAAGSAATQIVVMDGGFDAQEMAMATPSSPTFNASFAAAVSAAGLHYPCNAPHPEVREAGWAFWASEDYSRTETTWQDGASYWGQVLNGNYVLMNMTATISWSLVWSAYPTLVCGDAVTRSGPGLMMAFEPWSGAYTVSPPIWASAHTTQFAVPGWRYLHVPGGGSGALPAPAPAVEGGSYVTLVPEGDLSGLTVVVETLQGARCGAAPARGASNYSITFTTSGGLVGPGTVLHVWRTTPTKWFAQEADISVAADSTFSVLVGPDEILTVSTVATARHGAHAPPPPTGQAFPLPYQDDFNSYAEEGIARFFSDQGGGFSVRNGSLQQVVPADAGPNSWMPNPIAPLTMIGDPRMTDYSVEVDVSFSASANAAGLRGTGPLYVVACNAADPAQVFAKDTPLPGNLANAWGGSQACLTTCGCTASCIQFFNCNFEGCGAASESYLWNLTADGFLTNAGVPGVLTYAPADGSVGLVAPGGGAPEPGQRWAFDAATGLVSLPALGLCMSQSTPVDTRTYVFACARAGPQQWSWDKNNYPGYCLNLFADGNWTLVASQQFVLASGALAAPFDSRATHRLRVAAAGAEVTAAVDGAALADVQDTTIGAGSVFLGASWSSVASFDNFALAAT